MSLPNLRNFNMGAHGRIDDFRGTDAEYIIYLELKVQQLTGGARPPSPATSDGRTKYQSVGGVISDNSTLIIEQYDPQQQDDVRPAKRPRTESRWATEMKECLRNISSDWSQRRKEVMLSSTAEILHAFDVIMFGAGISTRDSSAVADTRHSPNDAVTLLSTFVKTTAALGVDKDFAVQVYHFRMFILVSLCHVMLSGGVDRSMINSIMNQSVSKSGGRNLDRLLRGARWVNRMMDVLATDHGLGHRASEIFVLWGGSIAQYGRFGEAGEAGSNYFKSLVPFSKPGPEIQMSLPFSVPFIIKTIVGPLYSLQHICSSLGYSNLLQTDEYSRYSGVYNERRMYLLEPTITAPRPAPPASFFSGMASPKPCGQGGVTGAPIACSIEALLLAAEQSEVLLGSGVNEQALMGCASTDRLGSPLRAVAGFNSHGGRSIFNDLEWEAFYNEDLDLFPEDEWEAFYDENLEPSIA